MVRIEFNEAEPYKFRISRDWRDSKDQLTILGIIFGIFVVFLAVELFQHRDSSIYFIILCTVLGGLILRYLAALAVMDWDLEHDSWELKFLWLKIPYKRENGAISDIWQIVTVDETEENQDAKSRLSLNRTNYRSSLEFWTLGGEESPTEGKASPGNSAETGDAPKADTMVDSAGTRNEGVRESMTKADNKVDNKIENKGDGMEKSEPDKNEKGAEAAPPGKVVFFARNTSSYTAHYREVKQNFEVAQELAAFFKGLGIPIGHQSKRTVRRRDEVLSES